MSVVKEIDDGKLYFGKTSAQWLLCYQQLERDCFDESIAIVGGASQWNRQQAEQCDIVVRCNDTWIKQGGRVDAVYVGGTCSPPEQTVPGVHWVIASGAIATLEQWSKFTDNGYCHDLIPWRSPLSALPSSVGVHNHWVSALVRTLRSVPLTGVLALRHLTLMPIKSVFVTGMDLYRREWENLTPAVVKPEMLHFPHSLPASVNWLRRLEQTDQRVQLDQPLRDAMSLWEEKFSTSGEGGSSF